MKQRPTVFIVGRQKNDKKHTISKAEMDERVTRVETFMRYRDKQERNSNE